MNIKEQVKELLEDTSRISHFEVLKTMMVIHLKDGHVIEVEPKNGGAELDYYIRQV
jgi:hypothetical protein